MPYLEQTIAASGSNGGTKGWIALLVVLLLLFLLPWPSLVSADSPDLSGLLLTWGGAAIVALITAWLVNPPRQQIPGMPPRRVIPPLLWTALLALPAIIQAIASTFGGAALPPTSRIVYLLISAVPIVLIVVLTILFTEIGHRRPRLGNTLKGCGFFFLILWYISMFPRTNILGGLFILLYFAIAICLIPAVIVRIHNINKQAMGKQADNGISPWIWTLSLPIVFLLFCAEIEFIGLPDFNSFSDVLVIWCLSGLASLIILLALKFGSKKKMEPPQEEMLQQVM